MRCVVIPNELSEAIYKKVEAALDPFPQLKDKREEIYHSILAHYDEHGVIPDFSIQPEEPNPNPEGE